MAAAAAGLAVSSAPPAPGVALSAPGGRALPWQRIHPPPAQARPGERAPTPTGTPEIEPAATPSFAQEPADDPSGPFVSAVGPIAEAQSPEPTPIRGGTQLSLPAGTTVVWGGCASDGTCYWYNFYWAPTHEVVMQPGEGPHKVQHELCHAHQHWSINGGAPLPPDDYDLESWLATSEGQSFTAAVASLAWPWSHSAVSTLEDFAWTCGYWYLDPAYLLQASPERYAWAAANLP